MITPEAVLRDVPGAGSSTANDESNSIGEAHMTGGPYPAPRPDVIQQRPFRTFGRIELCRAITAVGIVCVSLSFTVLDWLRSGDRGVFNDIPDDSTFSAIRSHLNQVHRQIPDTFSGNVDYGISRVYFGWLAWVLLLAVVISAGAALRPIQRSHIARALAFFVGLTGAGLTFWAIDLVSVSGKFAAALTSSVGFRNPGYADYLSHASIGFYFAVVGFILIGVGGALGDR